MGFLTPSVPTPPPVATPPPAAYPATLANPQTSMAAQNQRARSATAAGALMNSTVLTSPSGDTQQPNRAGAQLLSGAS